MNRIRLFFLPLLALLFCSCHPGSRYIYDEPISQYINDESVLKWEDDIRVFDSLNVVEPSGRETILVTGSSSVRLWDSIQSDLAPYQVMQRGYGGATMSDFNYYAERIIKPHDFKAILVFVANDITGGEYDRTPVELFLLYKTLVKKTRKRNPDTPLFWIEITPTPSRWSVWPEVAEANRMIREYCSKHPDLHFIPTSESFFDNQGQPDSLFFRQDMLHLNRTGYVLWSDLIVKALKVAGIEPSS
ncbi:MAG: GDSL-type esterase/lipase family protein [Bacteroidota bacterium]